MRAPSENRPSVRSSRPAALIAAGGTALALLLTGCSGQQADAPDRDSGSAEGGTVTLAVYDSFPAEEFAAAASAATGYEVEVVTAGDGGELSSKLVLTRGAPIADAFFGIDNSFAGRMLDREVLDPYLPNGLPQSALDASIPSKEGSGPGALEPGGSGLMLTAIDRGATCVNIDTDWFDEHSIEPPTGYEDLTRPEYRGLTVVLDPTSSSTGASFLIGTVAAFGESGFVDYWQRLVANGARIAQGWGEAYNGQFTQGGGEGSFPIVVSYATSPAFTVVEDGSRSTTVALADTCSSQIEYAGVLAGAQNPEGARAVLDYLVSREFQDTIAESIYMYPIDDEAFVPAEWERFAPAPTRTNDLAPSEIAAGLDSWLRAWNEATGW